MCASPISLLIPTCPHPDFNGITVKGYPSEDFQAVPLKIDIEIIGDPKSSSFLERKIRRILNDPTVTIRKTISHNTYGTQPPARRREFNRSRLQSFLPEGFTPRRLPYEQFFANVDSDGGQEGEVSRQKYYLDWSWGYTKSYFCYCWVRYAPAEPGWSFYKFRRKEIGVCDEPCYDTDQCVNWCKNMVRDWENANGPIDLREFESANTRDAFARSGGDFIRVGKPWKTWNLIL